MSDSDLKSPIHKRDFINVRIESDGTLYGAKVVCVDTGEVMNNVSGISINMKAGQPDVAVITLTVVPVNLAGKAMIVYTCKHCGLISPA